jgi:hypothetical protein
LPTAWTRVARIVLAALAVPLLTGENGRDDHLTVR